MIAVVAVALAFGAAAGCGSSEKKSVGEAPKVATNARPAKPPPLPIQIEEESTEEGEIPDESHLPPLPSGTFTGRFNAEETIAAELRLVVRDGLLLQAKAEVIGETRTEIALKNAVSPSSRTIRLIGRRESDFLRLTGKFEDAERATGTFTGTVNKKRVNGRWYAVRR